MNAQTGLIDYTDLTELGRGAQMTLLGFRAFATGGPRCGCLLKTYRNILGQDHGDWALGLLSDIADVLALQNARTLRLETSGCLQITHDEGSVLGAIGAAQEENDDLCRAHLTWLLARKPSLDLISSCEDFGGALNLAGLTVTPPETLNPACVHQSVKHFEGPRLVAGAMQ